MARWQPPGLERSEPVPGLGHWLAQQFAERNEQSSYKQNSLESFYKLEHNVIKIF